MIGRVLAMNLKKQIGDEVDLFEEPFKIVGIYESPIVFENAGVLVLQEELQRLQHRPNEVAGFTVTAKRPIDDAGLEKLRKEIEALQPGLEVKRPTDFVENVPQVRISRAVAWLTSAIALFIGAIGMLNTMVMSVFERTKEIGTLRAIGWRKSRVVRMVLGESLILSIAGAILGSAAGAGLAKFLSHMPNTAGVTQGDVQLSVFVQGFLVALIVGFLGAIYPALWSANLLPTEALRR
jgi:putative ABC transport system permease protein